MSSMNTSFMTEWLYDVTRKWFIIVSLALAPLTFVVNAPFGRFSPPASSWDKFLLVDGIKSWIIMELFSPLSFLFTYFQSPSTISLTHPANVLVACFLIHYANRALINPLRTPSRSKSHIIVPAFALLFNIPNGYLLATYLSRPATRALLATSYSRPSFYLGIMMWALGLYGNIWHDEVLLDIRRKAKVKGKAKEGGKLGEYYAIPTGGLYEWISYPNYFCEWVEWIGWAIAAAPCAFAFSAIQSITIDDISNTASTIISTVSTFSATNSSFSLASKSCLESFIKSPTLPPALNLPPPWLFVFSEILLMFPRAYNGHKWYKKRFEAYPVGRGVVLPGLL